MRKIFKSFIALGFFGVAAIGSYDDFHNIEIKLKALITLLKSDASQDNICSEFKSFQQKRDEILSLSDDERDFWIKRTLRATQKNEAPLILFCEAFTTTSRAEALRTAQTLYNILGQENPL